MGAQAGISAIRRDALTWGITAGVALTAGIALLLVPVELVFGVIAALVAGSVFLVSPYAGALAFIALYYMRPMDFFPQLALLRIPLFIASITSTGLFVRLLLARQKLVEGWYVKWFLALWGAMLLSVPLSLYRSQSFSGAQDFLKSVAMVWMIYMAVRSEKQITFAVRMLGWMALWLAVSTIYNYKTGNVEMSGNLQRAGAESSMLGDPNDLAAYILMLFPLCYYLFFNDPKRWLRLVYGSAMVMILVAVVLTGSRGGFLGLVVLLFLLWLFSKRKILGAFVGLAVFGAVWFTAPAEYRERIRSITNYEQDESAMNRVEYRKAAIRMFKRNPLTGIGFKNYPDFAREFGAPGSQTTHNMYYLVLGELGGLGLIVFLTIWLKSLKAARQLARAPNWVLHALGMGAFIGLLDLMVTGYFLSISYYPYQYILMALVAAAQAHLLPQVQ
ncbi:MAG: O-antigen ligase family protein, partial [Armatimonadota bacterium]|nr:O-antigen ligase family protein [Armatimonadota bacterium]